MATSDAETGTDHTSRNVNKRQRACPSIDWFGSGLGADSFCGEQIPRSLMLPREGSLAETLRRTACRASFPT
jgi:hypothetical protein